MAEHESVRKTELQRVAATKHQKFCGEASLRKIVARRFLGKPSLCGYAKRPTFRAFQVNPMFFASDNWAGAHPLIAQSLVSYAGGYASAYGTSDLDRRVEETFNRVFEREVAVFFVATGTAANSLALAATSRPGGI